MDSAASAETPPSTYWRTLLPQVGTKWRVDDSPLGQPSRALKFLGRDTVTYAIGSCFALNINRWLRYQGFATPDVSWGIHYNSRTILYELRRAAGLEAPQLDLRMSAPGGGVVYADALRHCIDADSAESLALIKERIAAESRRVFSGAQAFIITLGLSDTWEACVDGRMVTLNRAPYLGADILSGQHVDNVRNRNLSVDECTKDLLEVVDIIREHRGAVPIVFTISPVPLKHTGSGLHPHIANSRSKATLLTSVFELLDMRANDGEISYFPSYEYFQMKVAGADLWQGDARHPTSAAVSHVAEAFAACYSSEELELRPGFAVQSFG